MELSSALMALLASAGIPVVWLVPLSALLVLVLQRYYPNLKLPAPPKPNDPSVPYIVPNTPSVPAAPLFPNLSNRPLLSILLQLLAIKGSGGLSVEENAYADLLVKEIGTLKQIELNKV